MFGKNESHRPYDPQLGYHQLSVHSVFDTVQGEGPWAGYPAVFVRLQHCNLRCTFCDTEFSTGKQRELNELVADVLRYRRTRVVITGGEPMLQNLAPFIHKLNASGVAAQVETAGTVCQTPETEMQLLFGGDAPNVIVCSPKTKRVHKLVERYCKAWKYIIAFNQQSPEDGLPSTGNQTGAPDVGVFRPWGLGLGGDHVWVQPMDMGEQTVHDMLASLNTQAAVKTAMKYGYRLSLQLHKLVNLP